MIDASEEESGGSQRLMLQEVLFSNPSPLPFASNAFHLLALAVKGHLQKDFFRLLLTVV